MRTFDNFRLRIVLSDQLHQGLVLNSIRFSQKNITGSRKMFNGLTQDSSWQQVLITERISLVDQQ